VFLGGINDFEGATRENMDPENFLCQKCGEKELGYGQANCAIHGNEFVDHKCSFCCSIALFVTEGGNKFHCQPCFNDLMEKKHGVKTDCTGGRHCGLKISEHPRAPAKYPMGCSLCRSEKLSVLVREADVAGFNVEKRNDLMAKHGHINNREEYGRHVHRPPPGIAKHAGDSHQKCCTIF